jgi:Kef-type K+ transport system membrane component KefB
MNLLSQHEWILFFLQIGLMLAMAIMGGYLMRRFRHPTVMGELLGGMVLGPTIFGILAPDAYTWLFPIHSTVNAAREAVISLGMLFFLFSIGMELNLERVNERGKGIILASILGVLIPFGMGFGAVQARPAFWGAPEKGLILPIFIGTALSISALPVIARILKDLDLLDTQVGSMVITAAVIGDLVGWLLFAASLGALNPVNPNQNPWGVFGLVLAVLVLFLGLGRWLIRPLFRWQQRVFDREGGFISIIAACILAAAALAEGAGIHPVLGAFLVGVTVGHGLGPKKNNPVYGTIQQFAVNFFAPLYFVSVGLKANFARDFDLVLVIVVILIASIGKILGAGLGAWLGGLKLREALAVGSGLNARGAMEIIFASVALEYQVIDQRVFVALVVMALVTSMLSGPLMRWLMRNPGA